MIIARIVSHPVLTDGLGSKPKIIKKSSGFIKNKLFLIIDMCLGELP